ncbi:uncharacterized protein PV06_00338 [Exophiala oligosperma]|uniref:VOC domain-containing protein n=1 Tax=Exophiala oligosperma TaxID=215243 RepID=A0A0D2B5X0_9EURO|nr:uncharacterized protein PV06_00338 [Exophiala oligosperma]KIW47666.1 hypothetical protein PV06_00338 [Exophiala oligosperma]
MFSLITYDNEHHGIALAAIPDTGPKIPSIAGPHHRKAKNILPVWSVNQGLITSIYYKDPDGNLLETQVHNFDINKEAMEILKVNVFMKNPFGIDFDPEYLTMKLKSGDESHVDVKKEVEVATRMSPPSFY